MNAWHESSGIRVDANLFRLVYGAVSTEETRYYLHGVHIEPHHEKGAILVSTDGHRMIVAHDPEATCKEKAIVKLPRHVLAQCRPPKMFTSKRKLDINTTAPGSATILDITPGIRPGNESKVEATLTAHGVIIDGAYPDWRRVIPSGADDAVAGPIAFNSRYLKIFGDLGEQIGKSMSGGDAGMQITQKDAASPVLVRWSGADNIFAILMPIRDSVRGYLPDFMALPALQEAAA